MAKFHFISGFPRSGSTLLAAILSQNPRFSASFQSPVGQIVTSALEQMSHHHNESASLVVDEQRREILRGIFTGFYSLGLSPVVFDNNRRWCANMALLDELFPDSKVIACVRDPRAVVDSFERLFQAHPLEVSRIIGVSNTNAYDRVETLLGRHAPCGFAFNAFREAFFGPYRNNLLILDYDNLVQRPALVMTQLHKALNEESFEYDFDNLVPPAGAVMFDRELGLPGLHYVKPKVEWDPQPPMLPPDLYNRLPPPFWRDAPEVA